MANLEQVKLLKQDTEGWNAWRDKNPGVEPDLRDANLLAANLRGANLSRAVLHMANLNGTNLTEANLTDANLNGTNLTEANLTDANLNGAILHDANLNGATLHNADLHNVRMGGTIIAYTDLRRTIGITEIKHGGPSPVVLYTIQLPRDGTALHFLRGAGVPDEYIDLWRSTMLRPLQYHSLFISYSSKDETLARRLHNDLQAQGVRCWFAPEDMKIGDRIRQRIDEAIHLQDKLLLLLSEHSLASSWVGQEVEAAFEKEQRQEREMLFPIRLDDAVMQTSQAWAAMLRRTRHIGDFTTWTDPQGYQQAFERLLRDLTASATSNS